MLAFLRRSLMERTSSRLRSTLIMDLLTVDESYSARPPVRVRSGMDRPDTVQWRLMKVRSVVFILTGSSYKR